MKLLLTDLELLVGWEIGRQGILPIAKVRDVLEDLALWDFSQITGPTTIIQHLKGKVCF